VEERIKKMFNIYPKKRDCHGTKVAR